MCILEFCACLQRWKQSPTFYPKFSPFKLQISPLSTNEPYWASFSLLASWLAGMFVFSVVNPTIDLRSVLRDNEISKLRSSF